MSNNSDNKKTIDKYIEEKPECKLNQVRIEFLKGERKELTGYRLPRKLVFYNIENGRFAKEYIKIVREEGGTLNPENEDDAKKIKNLLLELNPTDTKNSLTDIKRVGQKELGLITRDGFLIDGNRRMALITELFETEHEEKYQYINVARIEDTVGPKDLWAIEAGISLGKDPKVEYGAINKLLKLEQGRKAGFSPEEIAKLLYGIDDPEKIRIDLAKLDLMKKYLREYYQDDEDFTYLEGLDTHFSELQSIMKLAKENDLPVTEQLSLQKVTFRLMYEKTYHRRLRLMKSAITDSYSLEKIVEAANKMEEISHKSTEPIIDDDYDESMSPTLTRYVDFEDEVKAQKNEDNVTILLNSILNNLKFLKPEDQRLQTEESKNKIQKIKTFVDKLTDVLGK